MVQTVELRTGAWYKEELTQLSFPDHWDIQHVSNANIPGLAQNEIRTGILNPIDCQPLQQLAQGKTSAVIIVDDLTRPTPAALPIQFITEELLSAGISPGRITILIAGGTHTPLTQEEIDMKLGTALHPDIHIETHHCLQNITNLGKTKNGTPIQISKTVLAADLKIGVGGIYPHPAAGFSGGAKILAPAAAGLETIKFLHDHFIGSKERGTDLRSEFRRECETIAETVGLDFIVNVVVNSNREIAGIFAGHYLSAWLKGVDFAVEQFSIEPIKDANIIIADAYPFDTSLQFAHDRGLWPLDAAPKEAEKIAIALAPKGAGGHVLFPATNSFQARLLRRIKDFRWRDLKSIGYRFQAARRVLQKKEKNYLFVSPNLNQDMIKSVFPAGSLYKNWDDLSAWLIKKYDNQNVRVAIYQNAPLLLPIERNEN